MTVKALTRIDYALGPKKMIIYWTKPANEKFCKDLCKANGVPAPNQVSPRFQKKSRSIPRAINLARKQA